MTTPFTNRSWSPLLYTIPILASLIPLTLALTRIPPRTPKRIIPSPRETLLPKLNKAEQDELAYSPDILPGARDVETMFGTMRVNEWGPVEGKKVVFCHGDATPSPLFGNVAGKLVSKGCRVITFGEFRLHVPSHEILFAITSSPISWTDEASGGFALIGFSLGGPICMEFLATYPHWITDLVLLGPAGLLKDAEMGSYKTYWFRTTLASTNYVRRLTGQILGVVLSGEPKLGKIDFSPATAVQWQFDHHHGSVHSFVSTIQYGPQQDQWDIWRAACDVISGKKVIDEKSRHQTVAGKKVLVICGEQDDVVLPGEVLDNLKSLMDENHIDWHTVPGNHGFPCTSSAQIGDIIVEAWGLT